MNRSEKRGEIRCLTGLFARQEAKVAQLTEAMNRAGTATEKAAVAEALLIEVDVLLECEQFDLGSADCRLCTGFSKLRHQTATLVVEAGRLHDRRPPAVADRRRA